MQEHEGTVYLACTPARVQGATSAWRRLIHAAVLEVVEKRGIAYRETDRLELTLRLYLRGNALSIMDLDNRLKNIMDALQGRVGGPKKRGALPPTIPNDRRIYRVIIEKSQPPKQSRGWGIWGSGNCAKRGEGLVRLSEGGEKAAMGAKWVWCPRNSTQFRLEVKSLNI